MEIPTEHSRHIHKKEENKTIAPGFLSLMVCAGQEAEPTKELTESRLWNYANLPVGAKN